MASPKNNVTRIKQYEQGRCEIVDHLFDVHGPALCSFLRGRMRTPDDVEDVSQEVFLRLSRMPDISTHLNGSEKQSRAYIFTMANNLIVDMERRNAVRRKYQAGESVTGTPTSYELSPEITVSGIQDLKLVENTILALPEKWRKAFVLSRFGHLNYQQIAERMGVTKRTVENYMSSALLKIRSEIDRARGGQK